MSKRLRLAKSLLKPQGLIFISIDHNELAQLKLLLDVEIFGEKNFVACITWKQLHTVKNSARYFSNSTEYILVYAKNLSNIKQIRQPLEKGDNYPYDDNDGKGKYKYDPLSARNKNIWYEFFFEKWNLLWKPPLGSYPRYSKETLKKMLKDDEIAYKENWKEPKAKRYLNRVQEGIPPSTFWDGKEVGFNSHGTTELGEILSRDAFLSPKPVSLIKRCLEIAVAGNKDAIILDFTAGSGTTGQALLELNKEDGGNRTFILCTDNENDICRKVCYPRLEKVIKGYKHEGAINKILFQKKITLKDFRDCSNIMEQLDSIKNQKKIDYSQINIEFEQGNLTLIGTKQDQKIKEGLRGNLKYFITDFIDAEQTDSNKKKMVDKSTTMLCLKEDCFDEIKNGHNLRIFTNRKGKLLGIIYDDQGIEPYKKEINKIKKKFITYVFSLDESAREEDFEDIEDFVELKPIPAVIMNVYKRIFK